MCQNYLILIFACLLCTCTAQWQCQSNSDCSELSGSVCLNGQCLCPAGQIPGLSGDTCVDATSYHASPCFTHTQCSRLFTGFECKRENGSIEGTCTCLPTHHYFQGRCWPSSDFDEPCTHSEQCISTPADPFALSCNGVCQCAEGYYLRQRGECRQIASEVGDGCVIDQDCQFANGVCDINTLKCVVNSGQATPNDARTSSTTNSSSIARNLALLTSGLRQQEVTCEEPCLETFACINGACVCPVGYYMSENRTMCYADLGSPSTPEQCVGLLAEVIDGICRCPPNFFYERNMRDCVRVTRVITQSCVNDANCGTFGSAARCGPPQADLWGVRNCECDPALSIWDNSNSICRLFVGLGEPCQENNECLAGEREAECVKEDGQTEGICRCPEGLTESDGLCLTTGLGLGEVCQAISECTKVENTVCTDGKCACTSGFRETDDYCEPIIGGICRQDTDCIIANTVCRHDIVENNVTTSTCQCDDRFVPHENADYCWPVAQGFASNCNVSSQCYAVLGENSVCVNNVCICKQSYHHRDGACWPETGLFENCERTSQCYLRDQSERVVCRNSQCQCVFNHPYSEELGTCVSSASHIAASFSLLLISLFYIIM